MKEESLFFLRFLWKSRVTGRGGWQLPRLLSHFWFLRHWNVNLIKETEAAIDGKLTGNSIDTTIKLAHRATLIRRLVTLLPPSNFIKSIFNWFTRLVLLILLHFFLSWLMPHSFHFQTHWLLHLVHLNSKCFKSKWNQANWLSNRTKPAGRFRVDFWSISSSGCHEKNNQWH